MAHFCFYNDTDVLFFVFIRIQASFIQTSGNDYLEGFRKSK
jgi:hypothetical protein